MADEEERAAQAMLRSSISITTMDESEREHFKFLQQSIGQNFISVLNDPRESDVPRAGWFGGMGLSGTPSTPEPAVKLSRIPAVSLQPIADYTRALGGNYEAWIASKKKSTDDTTARPAAESIESIVPPELFAPKFDVLASGGVVEALLPDCADPYSSQILMSKLEYFQKGVGAQLLWQVKQKSPQFFTALQNFNSLRGEVTNSLAQIADLRKAMAVGKEVSVTSNLRIAALKRRLENQKRVVAICRQMTMLQGLCADIRQAMERSEHQRVFSLLRQVVDLNYAELRRVEACASLFSFIELVKTRSFENAAGDFFSHITMGIGSTTPQFIDGREPWPDMGDDYPPEVKEAYVAKAKRLFDVLLTTGTASLRANLTAFRDLMFKEVKRLVGQTIIKSMQIIHSDPSLPPDDLLKGTKLRELSVQQFNFVLEQLFRAVHQLYRKALRITHVLEDITRESVSSGLDRKSLIELIVEARVGVVRMIQTRVVRMFEVRQEEHSGLTFLEIFQVMRLSFQFIFDLEALSDDSGADGAEEQSGGSSARGSRAATSSLRATLAGQAKEFFKKQHEKQQRKLLEILLSEQWVAEAEVDSAFQGFCDRMTDTSPEAVQAAMDMSLAEPGKGVLPPDEDDVAASSPRLHVGSSSYTISQSVLMLLRTLSDYENYVFAMPFLAHEVSQRVHDMLKVYDGQTAALVLGAGARDTAGLEAITVAHLAVSSQCLSFLADFAPRFRARLEAVLPAQSTVFLRNLERFSRDAINHRNEFYVKIVLMVKEGPAYSKAWKPQNWSKEVTPGISALLKEVGRVLKKGGLERVLDRPQLRLVLYPILYHYFIKIKTCVTGVAALRNEAAMDTVRQDILHYKANVENFGFSVLRSAVARDVSDTSWDVGEEKLPESDSEVLALFIPEGQ